MAKIYSKQRILKLLKRYKLGRTKKQLTKATGYINIGGRIGELREQGHNILTIMENGKNRYGDIVKYARYRLV